jgi:endogenous inhibitor of DNA gyrase (YacG/DUF329 family)
MPAKPPDEGGSAKESAKESAEKSAKGSAKPCPICGKPAVATSRPFCSERCRDVDLNRWLSNSYAIPAAPDDDEDRE